MNFGFNEEQELLRSTARKFFENECPSEVVRTLMDTPEGITPALWVKLAEQGWTCVHAQGGTDWPLHPTATATVTNCKAQTSRAVGIKSCRIFFRTNTNTVLSKAGVR